jgi:hypothetical protein
VILRFYPRMTEPQQTPNVIRPTDDDARALAQSLLMQATYAAFAVIDPVTQTPMVTRIALATGPDGAPVTLISDLSQHTRALQENPACSLLLGEPGDKGDPLTHPRLTLQCRGAFVAHNTPAHSALRTRYLDQRPKARLYIDFTDFRFVTFDIVEGFLNGGFGKAYTLAKADIIVPAV